jgi:uncharacterized membrane protein SpoIIM required for sporulation
MPSPALSARWMQKREAHWSRLEALLSACDNRGIRALDHRDVRELALLYRQTAADLSTARADPRSATLARYLNDLLGRAHNHVYTGAPTGARGIVYFYTRRFPQVFRETWRYTAAATLVFAVGAVLGVLLSVTDPSFNRFVLGVNMIDTIDKQQMWTHSIVAVKPLASSQIMTNNIAVSFVAFAGGILGGLGTFYAMLMNGLLIGVIGTACQRSGLGLSLWTFVVAHGSLELPSIFIAGGAGFVLAHGVLVPGRLSRRDALVVAGRQAVRLVLGVIPLLVIAGIIEGFVSPTDLATPFHFLIGGALFVLLTIYLLAAGRRSDAPIAASLTTDSES